MKTKEELRAELDARGIPYHHALGEKKLQALLDAATDPSETLAVSPREIVGWSVFDKSGERVRDYTIEAQGEAAEACARSYSEKIRGSYKPKE